MNFKRRVEVVRAMETLARCVNDENVFEGWLMVGVADGDITNDTVDEDLDIYTDDKTFSELMGYFLTLMSRAKKSGGLYADRIVSSNDY